MYNILTEYFFLLQTQGAAGARISEFHTKSNSFLSIRPFVRSVVVAVHTLDVLDATFSVSI